LLFHETTHGVRKSSDHEHAKTEIQHDAQINLLGKSNRFNRGAMPRAAECVSFCCGNTDSLLRPELTVVAQPGYEVGKKAAGTLLTILSTSEHTADDGSSVVTLKAELRIRKSTAAPPA
jgi:hypothetical protein